MIVREGSKVKHMMSVIIFRLIKMIIGAKLYFTIVP